MQINNNWITGFVDGDGCFSMQKVQGKNAIHIRYRFIIAQDRKSVDVLHAIKKRFKCKHVNKAGGNMYEFAVTDKKSLINIIIPFFIKYPLQSETRKDFYKFAEGLNNFMRKPLYENFYEIQMKKFKFGLNDQWLAKYFDAEGSLYIHVSSVLRKTTLMIRFGNKNSDLISELKKYLQCGFFDSYNDDLVKNYNYNRAYTIYRRKDLIENIFPRFVSKPSKDFKLKTAKRQKFIHFRQIVFLYKEYKKNGLSNKDFNKLAVLKEKFCQKD